MPLRPPSLPDFLGIGALKAGTTYLDAMLRSHPDVCLPGRIKEVEFFTRHFDRGPGWYQEQFRGCVGQVRGEVSPQYLFDARAAGRIHGLIPDAKLIVSVRDPVQRAYSQYKHWVQETAYRQSFDQFLVDHPGAVERGRYFSSLRPYLDLFPRDQLLVIVFEDLVAQPLPTMQRVYRFAGVTDDHEPATAEQALYVSASPRFHQGYVAVKRVTRWCRGSGFDVVVTAAKGAGLGRVFRTNSDAPAFDPMPASTARRLASVYADDVAALSTLVDRDLAQLWSIA
ncbi:MAG: hypothetical protein QOJ52_3471 [Acidimicrobiaceae bacterium]|nr:hypothetical protein [Acidimicrobiaceae bacterium]MDQ1421509.1 hypothetical protein [Acidimicrobiaceae bacterium]